MRQKIEEFMRGRYGADELSKAILGLCMVLLIVNLFTGYQPVYLLALVLLGLCYYRMLSRNIAARSSENRKYLESTAGIRYKFSKMKNRMAQSKEYHIYKCPSCGQKIRIPRGKGKIRVTCPKCKHVFEKRS